MNPRSFAAQVRRAIEAYTKATGVVPVVEFEGGERFSLRAPSDGKTNDDDALNVQKQTARRLHAHSLFLSRAERPAND